MAGNGLSAVLRSSQFTTAAEPDSFRSRVRKITQGIDHACTATSTCFRVPRRLPEVWTHFLKYLEALQMLGRYLASDLSFYLEWQRPPKPQCLGTRQTPLEIHRFRPSRRVCTSPKAAIG